MWINISLPRYLLSSNYEILHHGFLEGMSFLDFSFANYLLLISLIVQTSICQEMIESQGIRSYICIIRQSGNKHPPDTFLQIPAKLLDRF